MLKQFIAVMVFMVAVILPATDSIAARPKVSRAERAEGVFLRVYPLDEPGSRYSAIYIVEENSAGMAVSIPHKLTYPQSGSDAFPSITVSKSTGRVAVAFARRIGTRYIPHLMEYHPGTGWTEPARLDFPGIAGTALGTAAGFIGKNEEVEVEWRQSRSGADAVYRTRRDASGYWTKPELVTGDTARSMLYSLPEPAPPAFSVYEEPNFICPPITGDKRTYVGIGDSITAGSSRYSGRCGYFDRLDSLTTLLFGTKPDFYNLGIPGEKTFNRLEHISADIDGVLAKTTNKPIYIFMMEGTNDIWSLVNGYWDITYGQIIDNLLALLDEVHKKGLTPIWATIPPRIDNDVLNAGNETLNGLIRSEAEKRGIKLADMMAAFYAFNNYESLLESSSPHPLPEGYALIGETWYGQIDQNVTPPGGPIAMELRAHTGQTGENLLEVKLMLDATGNGSPLKSASLRCSNTPLDRKQADQATIDAWLESSAGMGEHDIENISGEKSIFLLEGDLVLAGVDYLSATCSVRLTDTNYNVSAPAFASESDTYTAPKKAGESSAPGIGLLAVTGLIGLFGVVIARRARDRRSYRRMEKRTDTDDFPPRLV